MASPEGPITIPMAGLADLVAACPRFRSVVGAANAAAALSFIHYPEVDFRVEPAPTRPLAIIATDDVALWEFDFYNRSQAGDLVLTFEFPVASGDLNEGGTDVTDRKGAMTQFCDDVGVILLEMATLKNTNKGDGTTYWNAVKATQLIAPVLCSEDKHAALFIGASYLITWR